MSFEPRDYLRRILVEADYIIGESGGLTFEKFMTDGTLQRAFARSLEIIGEQLQSLLASASWAAKAYFLMEQELGSALALDLC